MLAASLKVGTMTSIVDTRAESRGSPYRSVEHYRRDSDRAHDARHGVRSAIVERAHRRTGRSCEQELQGAEQRRGGAGGIAEVGERERKAVREIEPEHGDEKRLRNRHAPEAAEAGKRHGEQRQPKRSVHEHRAPENQFGTEPSDDMRIDASRDHETDGVEAEHQGELQRTQFEMIDV